MKEQGKKNIISDEIERFVVERKKNLGNIYEYCRGQNRKVKEE